MANYLRTSRFEHKGETYEIRVERYDDRTVKVRIYNSANRALKLDLDGLNMEEPIYAATAAPGGDLDKFIHSDTVSALMEIAKSDVRRAI